MNRITLGATAALAILVSASAFAANSTASTPAATPINYSEKCTSLADQWKSAETSHATNPQLGKARADAIKASKECKSTKTADMKKGVSNYGAALRLLGVIPT